MKRMMLDERERQDISDLVADNLHDYASLESHEFLEQATVIAHDLPKRVRETVNAFRLERLSGVMTISGHHIDQNRLGPTPTHWREYGADNSTARAEELLLILYASLVGDPFGWTTQQDGKLIHDVLPIRGHEQEQLGSSSDALLTWHTEDAFHSMRSDFLLFACLRNPYSAATTIGAIDDVDVSDRARSVLFEPRFFIKPDESHLPHNNSSPNDEAFAGIESMNKAPDPVAILFGDGELPYIRADPYFMSVAEGDHEARAALEQLVVGMDAQMIDAELATGDYCFIDNFRVVHGRKAFRARHDGTDRWLKRINVTRDLRKSRSARASVTARGIR
jgi:Fe(II)/alpha-ketoglutarate-dependent arginine beta-hydroxylase